MPIYDSYVTEAEAAAYAGGDTDVVCVQGTWAWNDDAKNPDWYQPGSPFQKFLIANHFRHFRADDPFEWTTAVDGLRGALRWFKTKGRRDDADHRDWRAGGYALRDHVADLPVERRNMIAHSHGLQVVLYACADHGMKVHNLISCGSPVRADMMDVARRARPNISQWLHIYNNSGADRMQIYGELCDGKIGLQRTHPLADVNDGVPGISHSSELYYESFFHLWLDQGWLAFLKLQGAAK